jgi:hypothetical protein
MVKRAEAELSDVEEESCPFLDCLRWREHDRSRCRQVVKGGKLK